MFPWGFACDVTELLKSVILGSTGQRFSDYLVKGSWLRSKWQTVTAQWCHDIGHISILTTQCSTHPRLLNIFQPAWSADLTDSNIVCLPSLRAAVTNRMFCCVKTDLHFLSVLPGILKYSHNKPLSKVLVWITQRRFWLVPAGSWCFKYKEKKEERQARRESGDLGKMLEEVH